MLDLIVHRMFMNCKIEAIHSVILTNGGQKLFHIFGTNNNKHENKILKEYLY